MKSLKYMVRVMWFLAVLFSYNAPAEIILWKYFAKRCFMSWVNTITSDVKRMARLNELRQYEIIAAESQCYSGLECKKYNLALNRSPDTLILQKPEDHMIGPSEVMWPSTKPQEAPVDSWWGTDTLNSQIGKIQTMKMQCQWCPCKRE